MGQHNLSRIMKPQQVAVVGASEKSGTIGNALMKNLLDGGFPGTVLPVNPKSSGIPTFETPERAVRAFLYMVAFAENQKLLVRKQKHACAWQKAWVCNQQGQRSWRV